MTFINLKYFFIVTFAKQLSLSKIYSYGCKYNKSQIDRAEQRVLSN